ncbi:hypothetical protein GGI15_000554 [Coemansia interrupta]|uniref:glycerophosphodiester phosphodiesterase n=1 Tax=Coemansia interrupta TaxID=1126814 RepID=A0A9W8LNT8_9FUNG|nr:hypothetical protein GGI15_000554 [Coemansia interrupta]
MPLRSCISKLKRDLPIFLVIVATFVVSGGVILLVAPSPSLIASASRETPLSFASVSKNISSAKWNTLSGGMPQLVGHRGEKAFMPEHSLGSYWQAALEGADYIEPDLGLTKDGHLVVNHNEYLGETTNIASIEPLAYLRTNKTWVDDTTGMNQTVTNEWFISDMTLEQVKMVRINQDAKYPWRPQHFNGFFSVLTFEEYLQTILNLTNALKRPFGVIPELKSPKLYNRGRVYDRYFEDRAILTMEHYGWANITRWINRELHADLNLQNISDAIAGLQRGPSAWQSFDLDTARYLAQHTDTPVVALVEKLPWAYTPKGLDQIAQFAKIVSSWKDVYLAGPAAYLQSSGISWDDSEIAKMGGFIRAKDLPREIHSRGMEMSPYTFYDSHQDMGYLCSDISSTAFCPRNRKEELFYFFELGVDYLFVENIVEASMLRLEYDNTLK